MKITLLQRQLRRAGLSPDVPPTAEQWRALLATIERTYDEVDQDRYTLERSLAISSEEMRQLYNDLRRSSESQLAEEHRKLRKSVAIHEAILEAAVDGVLVVDEQRTVVSHSRRFHELWGLEPDADMNLSVGARIAGRIADPVAFAARVEAIYAGDTTTQEEIEMVDGRVLDRVSAPIRGENNESYGRVWFFRDVTARKEQENRIREVNRFLDSIVENIPHTVYVKEAASLRYVRLNRAGERVLGITQAQVIWRNAHELFPRAQADELERQDRAVLAQRDVVTIEEEPVETAMGTRYMRTKKIPILDNAGRPIYLLGISEDVTEVRRRHTELLAAKETAELASRAKSDFLLNMSHELRTPLNAILGFGRILERELTPQLSADHHQFLQDVVGASRHMLALVNDLLDLRGLEENRLALVPIALAPIIEEAVSLLRPLIDEYGLRFELELAPDLPLVHGNHRAVAQVLINLISNAAKFTPHGGLVKVAAVAHDTRVHVSIRDTGIGIAPEDQTKLFKYFEQVGDKHAHNMKGSGVGLALTRVLIERQGGAISVRSAVGVGSTFNFDLEVAS